MRKQYPVPIRDNTDEEDAEIKRQIAEDPDLVSFTGKRIVERPTPPERAAMLRKQSKRDVTVALDADLIDALKSLDPNDWHARLNAIARASLGM